MARALNESPRARRVAEAFSAAGVPMAKGLVQLLIDRFPNRCTLLAVCPNSAAVTRAALLAAREANAPLLLAATLNQVDVDGGYTGWTPQALVDSVTEAAASIGLDVPVIVGLDHGGPWLKDLHVAEGYAYAEAMASVKQSLGACIAAGYQHLHIDATLGGEEGAAPLPVGVVAERTLALIEHAEACRIRHGRGLISYEVGTEEVAGGLARAERFSGFLDVLDAGLRATGREANWPAFVVGKVDTDLHSRTFSQAAARQLTALVQPYGALLKGHYTDYVTHPEAYPRSGMGGANVGPEFTEREYRALRELVRWERQVGAGSGLLRVLEEAVVASGRWRKWLQPHETGLAFSKLEERRRAWLVGTGCRYVWTQPAVVDARAQLYHNLRDYCDPEAYVLWRIKEAMLRYYHAFNMIDFNDKILQATPAFE